MTDFETALYVVTCQTEGCINFGHALEVPALAANPRVVCGPCGVQITDIRKL